MDDNDGRPPANQRASRTSSDSVSEPVGALHDDEPDAPPEGFQVLCASNGTRTFHTSYRDPQFGFTRVELRREFYGDWSCESCRRSWDAAWLGPKCTVCGNWGTPPGAAPDPSDPVEPPVEVEPVRRPPRRPPGHVPTARQIVARLEGLRRHLRAAAPPEGPARLQWVAGKVAEMLTQGDLRDIRAAAHTLAADAEAIGVDREGAQQIILLVFYAHGLVTAA